MSTDRDFMQHWNEYHHAASTDGKAERVGDLGYLRIVHDQDHANRDGMLVEHDHYPLACGHTATVPGPHGATTGRAWCDTCGESAAVTAEV